MAMSRMEIRKWEGVKFQNFPLHLHKETEGSNVYVFGGREYSITGHWGGVVYSGRYRFHVPKNVPILEGVFTLSKKLERVKIIAKEREEKLEREYFTLTSSGGEPRYWVVFIGGWDKYTLSGIGASRMYEQYVEADDVEVIAETSNRCRSGRFGAWAKMLIAPHPIEVRDNES